MKTCKIRHHSDSQQCDHCHKAWDYGDYDGTCGLDPVGPSPEEEFWFNIAHSAVWLCCVVLLILCVYITQPEVLADIRNFLQEWAK